MATTLANMGLRAWDLGSDPFSYSELANNWSKVDTHDHTTGKGLQIPTGGIANLAVTGPKIAAGAIDNTKVANGVTLQAVGAFRAYLTSNISTPSETTPIIFNNDSTAPGGFDVSGWYDNTTGRYTPQVAGYYRFSAVLWPGASASVDDQYLQGNLLRNGASVQYVTARAPKAGDSVPVHLSGIWYLNGTTDTMAVGYVSSYGTPTLYGSGAAFTTFCGELIGR